MTTSGCGQPGPRNRRPAQDRGPEPPCACRGNAPPPVPRSLVAAPWIDGAIRTTIGNVPRVRTTLTARDHLGAIKVRWAVSRMRAQVPPGLYGVGTPKSDSPVLVSANYKLSFDHLRRALSGRAAWILVLDTRGINVWCAAGKGTFGTDELVRRVEQCRVSEIVSHRKLIVPQLGATGVSAHEVLRRCGFRVVFGPVRASELPRFLENGLKASPEMRRVHFDLRDRLVLIPVELVTGAKGFLAAAALLAVLGGIGRHGYSLTGVRGDGLLAAAVVLGAFIGAAVFGPILLPWLPGRAFSVKGAVLGLAAAGALVAHEAMAPGGSGGWMHPASWLLLATAVSSFTVMNFTGASTFTSLSGVLREMRFAVPAQIAAGALGVVLWTAGLFFEGGR